MTDLDLLLRAVLNDPDDDGARLAYADLLEEHGEALRAEFIRVQVRLAEHERARGDRSGRPLPPMSRDEAKRLRCRNHELLDLPCPLHPEAAHRLADEWLTQSGWPDMASLWWVIWRRGLVERVTCTAADWLAHADAILAAQPVTKVTLTTLQRVEALEENGGRYLCLPGRPHTAVEEREWDSRKALAAEWPHVREWTLPHITLAVPSPD